MTDTEVLEIVLANLIKTEERSKIVVQPVIDGCFEVCRDVPTSGPLTRLTNEWYGLGELLDRYDDNQITLYQAIQTLTYVIEETNKTIMEEF